MISDILYRAANDLWHVHVTFGRDLPGDKCQAGGDHGLAGNTATFVLGNDRIQNRIGNGIGDFVGMPFGHRFRGEKEFFLAHGLSPLI